MAVKKKKKPKKAAIDLTLWDVILSYPDLHEPKPFKGKIYFKTDVLLDKDHPQLGALRAAIKKVKVSTWGEDKTEWPEAKKPLIQDGDAREDQKGYKGRVFITPATQQQVPVVNLNGSKFPAQSVKGGMFGNVAVRISAWEFDGDEGVSIYLQGVMIDTTKDSLNFGGGKSVKQMFDLDEDAEESDDSEEDEDEEDKPRAKKKRRVVEEDEDDSDDEDSDDDEEEETPPKRKKKRVVEEDDEEEDDSDDDSEEEETPPKRKKKKVARNFDEDED